MATEPLTLEQVYGVVPHGEVVDDVYGDRTQLLLGHLNAGQVLARLQRQPWWSAHRRLDESTLHRGWVVFDRHHRSCTAPDRTRPQACGCRWTPQTTYHWREATEDDPAAVAVTTIVVDDAPNPGDLAVAGALTVGRTR